MSFDINKIPHINEIANNGSFNGARSKNTETFQQRCSDCNKIVPLRRQLKNPDSATG